MQTSVNTEKYSIKAIEAYSLKAIDASQQMLILSKLVINSDSFAA